MRPWKKRLKRGKRCQKSRNHPLEEHGECGGEGGDVHSLGIEALQGRSV